jgi:hypothetical protein
VYRAIASGLVVAATGCIATRVAVIICGNVHGRPPWSTRGFGS